MTLKPKYEKIKKSMIAKYGKDKGTKIFYAWVNKEDKDVEMKSFNFLSNGLELKSIDGEEFVEGFITTGDPDAYNDIVTESCMDDMVEQLKSLKITIDDNHESFKDVGFGSHFKALNPIAKIVDASRVDDKILVKAVLNKANARYEEIKSSIKEGFLHSFSFAFVPRDWEFKSIDGVKHRLLKAIGLLNGCFTGIPVNSNAVFGNVALKALDSFSSVDDDEVQSIVKSLNLGGVSMVEDEKNVDKPKAQEEETKSMADVMEQFKSLEAKIGSLEENVTSLKSRLDEAGNDDSDESDSEDSNDSGEGADKVDAEVKALKEKVAELEGVLNKPNFKSMIDKNIVDDSEKDKKEAEVKSKNFSPVDLIRG